MYVCTYVLCVYVCMYVCMHACYVSLFKVHPYVINAYHIVTVDLYIHSPMCPHGIVLN
jgi:hypothetical protein